MKYGYKLTTNGRALITKCAALEKPLVLTRVAVGSGRIADGTDLADVHKLVSYVTDGTIGERTHKEDRLYFTVQYATNTHPDIPTFNLSEFIVYAKDPETGGEVDVLYATLGDYQQPVPAFSPSLPPSVWNFPVMLVVSGEVEVNIHVPAGLVTYDDLQEAVHTACKELIDSMASGGIKKTITFTIPVDDWVPDPQKTNGLGFYYDLMDAEVSEKMVPSITIAEGSLETACCAGVSVTATTYAGYIRMKSVDIPTEDIQATCQLLVQGSPGGGGGTFLLPVATSDTLGGVRIPVDSGLRIDPKTGNLSVEVANPDETRHVIDDAFASGQKVSDT